MFRCGMCQKVSVPSEKAFHLVTRWKDVTFPPRLGVHRFVVNGKEEVRDDPGGRGTQIVTELLVCKACSGKKDEANV